jgi:hypothetical protein
MSPEIVLELVHVSVESNVVTLDLVLGETLVAGNGEYLPAGHLVTLELTVARGLERSTTVERLRRWTQLDDPVIVSADDFEVHQRLLISHGEETIVLEFTPG